MVSSSSPNVCRFLHKNAIYKGKRPYVDPRYRTRSYIEGQLIEIMEQCWVHNRMKRPTIFELVTMLHDVKREAKSRGELQLSSWLRYTTDT